MYSLDVNFLSDRGTKTQDVAPRARRSTGPVNWTPAIAGALLGALFPLLALGALLFAQSGGRQLQSEKAEVDQELAALQAEIAELNRLSAETEAIEGDTASLVGVFDKLKPWSAVLQDVSNRVPTTVRLQSVKQSEGDGVDSVDALVLSGNAESYEDVNDFMLTLGGSSFFEKEGVVLQEATLADDPTKVEVKTSGENAPQVKVEPAQVVNYTINAPFAEWTYQGEAGETTLVNLSSLGAEGLVTRIEELKAQGVID